MELAIQIVGWICGLTLEILIIAALVKGSYKRFPFIFAYIVANFLTTVIEIRLNIAVQNHEPRATYWFTWYYWRDEAVLQLLMFAVVISLIYDATSELRARRMVLVGLASFGVLFAGITFLIHYDNNVLIGQWMTPWTRDLNFSSTVLDLALWAILIVARRKKYKLLMLSGALGILFTGEAIGQSLRDLGRTHAGMIPGNILMMLTNLTAMYIWWQTLRESKGGPKNALPAGTGKPAESNEPPVPKRNNSLAG